VSGKLKSLAVLVLVLAAVAPMGCSCSNRGDTQGLGVQTKGVSLEGPDQALVGQPRDLDVLPILFKEDNIAVEPAGPLSPATLRWTVEPSDGAVVSPEGVFKASKPGVYRVTATQAEAPGFSDSMEITVTSPESAFAGTYKGTFSLDIGPTRARVPIEFTVSPDGKLAGGYKWVLSQLEVRGAFTGTVSEEGEVTANGTHTNSARVGGKTGSNSGPITMSGRISGTTFSGTVGGDKGSGGAAVVAER
jgi:hypothetical protein